MHRLSFVEIKNYKSIKRVELSLSNFTPLVGQNNAGKSNILEAIEWFLGQSGLKEPAFNDPEEEIEVIGVIEGIDAELFSGLDEKHQKQIKKYIQDGTVTFKKKQLKPSGRKSDRKLFVKDPTKGEDDSKLFKKAPTGLPEALDTLFPDCIFIRAMDNATKDLSKNQRNTTIGQLISSLSNSIRKENENKIDKSLGILEELFGADSNNRAEQLEKFDKRARQAISKFFPGIRLKLHIPPPTLDDILGNGTVQVFEEGEEGETLRDFDSLGHGAQRSIQMAMIRLLADLESSYSSSSRKFLLIEEPELYLHPNAITTLRIALKNLSKENFQVIFATHSPIVISQDDIPDTIIIKKRYPEGTYRLDSMRKQVKSLISEYDKQADVLFELTNTSKILFSDKVILLEGKTDKITIPFLHQHVSQNESDYNEVEFIPMNGGGGIPNAREILSAMDIKCLSLVDLDFCFREALAKGLIELDGDDIEIIEQQFEYLVKEEQVALDAEGFPINNDDGCSSAEAYQLFADIEDVDPVLKKIQNQLSNEGYWFWRSGDLESTLGLESKNRAKYFVQRINRGENWEKVVDRPEEVKEFISWINTH